MPRLSPFVLFVFVYVGFFWLPFYADAARHLLPFQPSPQRRPLIPIPVCR